MGKFGRKFRNKLVKEQKKAMNKVYKREGLNGLLSRLEGYPGDTAELIGSMDVEAQEGEEIQGSEEGQEETITESGQGS